MKIRIKTKGIYTVVLSAFLIMFVTGCKKFFEIPLPLNNISGDGAFINDNTTSAVVTGIFFNMVNETVFHGFDGVGNTTGLYTDEIKSLKAPNPWYTNAVTSGSVSQWASLYRLMYQTNRTLEGIRDTKATLIYKNQWLGESLFARAYINYYLVNLFGDVPILLSSNAVQNNVAPRNPKAEVYQQIIKDLLEARDLLPAAYQNASGLATTIRVRPNQNAADAMLARVYLETSQWAKAEERASLVLSNSATYQLSPTAGTFLAASRETIWALAPTGATYVRDWDVFNKNMPAVITTPPATYIDMSLSDEMVTLFDRNVDLRFKDWIRKSSTSTTDYFFPNKYKTNVNGIEHVVTLRLAEQYLIRAEARVMQNKLTGVGGAKPDLDAVRSRAGLPGSTASNQTDMLDAVALERRRELFAESGFRFIDLKRTGKIDEVMKVVAPLKGGTWSSFKQLLPIPVGDLEVNRNLTQNPGY